MHRKDDKEKKVIQGRRNKSNQCLPVLANTFENKNRSHLLFSTKKARVCECKFLQPPYVVDV